MTEHPADLLRTAHHEAGHIIAAQAFGRPIIAHSIDPDETSYGRVHLWPNARYADQLRESLVILCAGAIAAHIWDPGSDDGSGSGAGSDTSQIITLGWTLCGRLVDADVHHHELQLAERRAARLIARNWDHVEAVSRSLVTHHRLVARGPHVECVGDLDNA